MSFDNKILSEELDKIDKEHGGIDPHVLVDLARDPDYPLHSCFEWDDTKAGQSYRLTQARKLIKTVVIKTPSGLTTPKFLSVRIDNNVPPRLYEPVTRVVENRPKYTFAMQEALKQIEEVATMIEALSELASSENRRELVTSMRSTCSDLKTLASEAIRA